MSTSADDKYEQQNDDVAADAPVGDVQDDEYVSRPGQKGDPVPVTSGEVEDPIDAATADSDETLARDDKEAIDESNIIDERTRGAAPDGGYAEPGDDEGLGGADDGESAGAGAEASE